MNNQHSSIDYYTKKESTNSFWSIYLKQYLILDNQKQSRFTWWNIDWIIVSISFLIIMNNVNEWTKKMIIGNTFLLIKWNVYKYKNK